jgi:acyl-CoA thioester hydrolase
VSFRYSVPKRFTDLDVGGDVDHGVVIDYLQEARTEFLLTAPEPMPAMLDSGVLVTAHKVEYLAPISYQHPVVDAELWVDQVGGARFSVSYLLSDCGVPVVRARTFLAPYDLHTGTLRRLYDAERGLLIGAVEDPVDLTPLAKVTTADLDDADRSPARVRWADRDSYGHVNNVRYFDYLMQGRLELLGGAWPADIGEPWKVTRQDIDYRRSLDFRREPYQVRTGIVRADSSSVEFVADIIDPAESSARPYATARTVAESIGPDGKRQSFSDAVRDRLNRGAH